MTVEQLREALATMPGHWPVHVEVRDSNPFHGADYFYTLDCVRDSFPSQGNMAVIRLDDDPS